MTYYTLDGHTPVVGTVNDFAELYKGDQSNRIVRQTPIGEMTVSTVFLGIDHNFSGEGPPLLFETMIFGGPHNGREWRCSTWDEAEAQHDAAIALVKR